VRRAIVPALAKLNSGTASEAVRLAIQDPDPLLKASAVPYLDRLDGEEGFRLLSGLAMDASGDRVSRQSAWRELGNRAGAASSSTETQRRTTTDVLARGLDQLLQGKLPAHLQLDLLEAGAASSDPSIRAQLKHWSDSLPKDNPLAAHQPALEGGNAQNGRRLFLEKPETQCVRCHKIANNGGTVGPGLDGVGKRLSRQQLLESIVTPNAQIAAGFENVVLTLKNGTSIAGTLKQETNGQLLLLSGEDGEVNVNASDVQSRQRGLSAMPDGLATLLTRFELRDLIEYLASLK
jgi:quinoprotein glucose dehydrogenase